jgi:hypothetical protein
LSSVKKSNTKSSGGSEKPPKGLQIEFESKLALRFKERNEEIFRTNYTMLVKDANETIPSLKM